MKYTLISISCLSVLLLSTGCSMVEQEYDHREAVKVSGQLNMDANTPIKEMLVETLIFDPARAELPQDAVMKMSLLKQVGVESVKIYGPAVDSLREKRLANLVRLLRGAGIESTRILRDQSDYLDADTYRIEAAYLTMAAPVCPDWSASSVQSYSNLPFSNMGCAVVTNVGQQMLHPSDLTRGRGDNRPDSGRTAQSIEDWRSGKLQEQIDANKSDGVTSN